jgi:hypothetical protein
MKLLNLTRDQKMIFSNLMGGFIEQLLMLRFNDPAADTLRLRQHASLCGSIETFQALLSYDDNQRAAFEERMREKSPQP